MFSLPRLFFDATGGRKPAVMGIVNVTPDSFFDGGKYADKHAAVEHACRLAEEGADIIDIGGESTRPGAAPVSEAEELDRVCGVVEETAIKTGLPISVDTTKSAVARAAAAVGAVIVNDISGGTFDDDMLVVAAQSGCAVVLGHTTGSPQEMQQRTHYANVTEEIASALTSAAERAAAAGIHRENIVLDPGIGFGKTIEDNYRIIAAIEKLKKIGFPLLIGLSRKSLISKLYLKDEDTLPATIALNAAAVLFGADIIRVHDVREHVLALTALVKLMGAQ